MKMCEGHEICDAREKPANIDFEMVSGRATYIGSIKYSVSTKTNNFYLEDWKVEDDFEKVKKTFTSLFPTHTEPIENLAKAYNEHKYGEPVLTPEVYTTIPVTVGLSNYKILHLKISSKVVSNPPQADVKLKEKLINSLKEKRVFENIISITSAQDPFADLLLNLEIIEIREFMTRAPLPLFPPQPGTLVVVNRELVDLKTGKNNGSFRVESTCSNRFGCTKDNFTLDFALATEQIVDYILRNMY